MVETYIMKRADVSTNTANKELRYLRAIFNYGIKRNFISHNPTDGIDFLLVEKNKRYQRMADDRQTCIKDFGYERLSALIIQRYARILKSLDMSVRVRNTMSVIMPLENGKNTMRVSSKIKKVSHEFSHSTEPKKKGYPLPWLTP
jgi:hypothetical protein